MFPATKAVRKELFPIVDQDGLVKPAIQLIIEEALASGIEEVCLVVAPGGDRVFREYFSGLSNLLRSALRGKPALEAAAEQVAQLGNRLTYVTQTTQDGYGDAVLCAQNWADGAPVLVMLGDHVYLSNETRRCARQVMEAFTNQQAPLSGVIRKPAMDLHLFGTVSGVLAPGENHLYAVDRIVEKPDKWYARKHLCINGLPEETYLCWFGLHAMTPDIFDCLGALKDRGLSDGGELQFTDAQAMLAAQRPYYALEVSGEHYDIGVPEGYVKTVEAFANKSNNRSEYSTRQKSDV